jgi:hypothetical protein
MLRSIKGDVQGTNRSVLKVLQCCVQLCIIMQFLSAVGSPARADTVCPRFHHMFALTHFPLRTSACSIQYIGLSPIA